MNETTKTIVTELSNLYMRADDEYFKLHLLSVQAESDDTLDSDVIARERDAALAVLNALFSARLTSQRAREEYRYSK